MLFELLCVIHTLIWVFVLFAFVDKRFAYINVYVVIPIIYFVHMLPFHILMEAKAKVTDGNVPEEQERFYKKTYILFQVNKFREYLEKCCTFSPLSPQGMLLFGMITSVFRIYPPRYLA